MGRHFSVLLARQHAMLADRNIVLLFLSVSPMPVLYLNEWTYCRRLSHFSDGRGTDTLL